MLFHLSLTVMIYKLSVCVLGANIINLHAKEALSTQQGKILPCYKHTPANEIAMMERHERNFLRD